MLTTRFGKSYGDTGFSDKFRAWCDAAGLPQRCVYHGLRKAACRHLAEAGCTVHEIAAISGHASLREVERYTKAVEQVRLAKKALAKTAAQENKSGCEVPNPDPTEVSNPLKVLAQ